LTVHPAQPATFPLKLRIPRWATNAEVVVPGEQPQSAAPGLFPIEREWKDGDVVELRFAPVVRVERAYRNGLAVERGPLVFSLPVGAEWQKIKGEEPHADWEVHPTTPWNYGLLTDAANPGDAFKLEQRPVGDVPFSPDGAPLALQAKGRQLPEWKLVAGSAGPLPESPAASSQPDEDLTLIPYGATNLRLTVFPQIRP
jgi:hypothetical protein